ncbi:MAG: hypothetical protein V7K21_20220 [Nostoc sp.]|uniref:hypothetical protein n=1 Tax=Nostoc sp. TaxID=1180 RepID=UPI002FF562A3
MNYINVSRATVADLQPRTRLYAYNGDACYVARIGFNQDFAVYKGGSDWGLDTVADHGIKIGGSLAIRLFPICAVMGLRHSY